MQFYERDFFVYRIINSYQKFKIRDIEFKLICPNAEVTYEANRTYYNTFRKCKENEHLEDEDLYILMCGLGLWDDEREKRLTEDIPNYLEECKIEVFKEFDNKEKLRTIRKYIKRVEEEYNKLFNIRHSYDYMTCHGAALFAKAYHIIESCTYHKDKIFDWDNITKSEVLEVYNSNQISEIIIRELSRTDPWSTMWSCSKRNNLFEAAATQLTEDQRRLVSWSLLYDNVREHPEAPDRDIIEDDDAFDGWMILKNRENIRKKKESDFEKRLGKNAKAGEVFVIAKNKEEAEDIYSLNNDFARNIIRNRIDFIKQHGEVDDKNLPDVKQKNMMEMNRKALAHGKG